MKLGSRNEHICPTNSVLWEMATPGRGVYRPPGLLSRTDLKPALAPDSPYSPYAHSVPPGPPTPLGPDMFPFYPLSVLLPRSVSKMLRLWLKQHTHCSFWKPGMCKFVGSNLEMAELSLACPALREQAGGLIRLTFLPPSQGLLFRDQKSLCGVGE